MQTFNLCNFWWRNVVMWAKWNKPSSPFVATVSLVIMIVGLIGWILGTLTNTIGIGETISIFAFWIGASISFGMLVFWAPYKRWKECYPEKVEAQKRKPEAYIFPYIHTVSASPVIDSNENILHLTVCFPSALLFNLSLHSVTGTLSLSGSSPIIGGESEPLASRDLDIEPQSVSTISAWPVKLTNRLFQDVKSACPCDKPQMPVKITLKLKGKDKQNNLYEWKTEQWTTLLLTKVN